jgi:putative selenium metabolism hydrolase
MMACEVYIYEKQMSIYSKEQEECIELTRRLVQIPSMSGEEAGVAALVQETMRSMGYDDISVDEFGDVLGTRQGASNGPTRLFDGHMDVVPVTCEDEWQHQPFGAEISAGRMWGRGTADTKGSLAAILCAVGRLPRDSFTGKLVVVASVCEENMTGAALSKVLDQVKPDVFITGEPTSLRLATAQKGRLSLHLTTHGRAAHTSRPELGDNAVYKMFSAVQALKALPLPSDPQLGQAVLELTEIISSPYPNPVSVPDGCHAHLVGRIMPGETDDEILDKMRSVLESIPGSEIDLAELRQDCYTHIPLVARDFLPGWRNDPAAPWQQAILRSLESVGLKTPIFGAPCGTNASAAAGVRGIPSFIYGAGSLEQAHIVDEWVSVDELVSALEGFKAIARSMV